MKAIVLHILQSFPFVCLNRDENNAPKVGLYGGVMRARVSSQCLKRATRLVAQEMFPKRFQGVRTRRIIADLTDALVARKLDPGIAKEKAEAVADFVAKKDNKHEGLTKALVFYSPQEIAAIADSIVKEPDAPLKKGSLKKILKEAKVKDAADIALFGRMVANDPSLNVEGASAFSHALSVHAVENEIDFFAAVDDKIQNDGENGGSGHIGDNDENGGSGHIGDNEYNSACYYRCVVIDLETLADEDHLKCLTTKERQEVLTAFIKAVVTASPTAKRNAMFGSTMPSYVLATRQSKGQVISLAGAFEKPLRSTTGYNAKAAEILKSHWEEQKNTFGLEADVEVELPGKSLNDLCKDLTDE